MLSACLLLLPLLLLPPPPQTCSQVLLTLDNLADRSQYINARNTFTELLAYGTIPVVNENVRAGPLLNSATSITRMCTVHDERLWCFPLLFDESDRVDLACCG
jgi:hypothetical protein